MSARCIGTLALAGLAALLAGSGTMAQGQTPPPREESVAAAARRAQAQRRASGKAVREYTNDNLPAAGRVAVIGEEGAYPASDATAPRPAPSAEDEKERSNADGQLKAEKDRLEALKKELEVVERQRRLDNAQLYSNPQAAETNPAGRATLAAQDQDIEARKAAIAAAQAKVTELEEKARSVNERLGPRAEEPKSPEQVRDTWSGKLRPLRDELARVESELSGMRASAGSGGLTGFAAERAQTLEQRRADLQRQIADLEDQARRAGSLPPQ